MEYSIRELSELAGVSARTLRYYDEMNLLKPKYVTDAGYRFYGEEEVQKLWQILFYRERGLGLKQITEILNREDYDVAAALEVHLRELEAQRERMDAMIATVRKTLASMKGDCVMSQEEKFEIFKKKLVEENEVKYGKEIREKYGEEQAEDSNQKLLNMSETEYERFRNLEAEINRRLKDGVQNQILPQSEEAKKIFELHRGWIQMTWKQYTPEAHKGLASMYLMDERFKVYYDKKVEGCAELLVKIIHFWVENR